jgi:hypothetical protein
LAWYIQFKDGIRKRHSKIIDDAGKEREATSRIPNSIKKNLKAETDTASDCKARVLE